MGLAPLDVAALLDQVADLVRGDGQLALRADVQGGGDQEVVAPTLSFRRLRLSSFGYGHESLSRSISPVAGLGRKDHNYRKSAAEYKVSLAVMDGAGLRVAGPERLWTLRGRAR
jgi:hypothetical protein